MDYSSNQHLWGGTLAAKAHQSTSRGHRQLVHIVASSLSYRLAFSGKEVAVDLHGTFHSSAILEVAWHMRQGDQQHTHGSPLDEIFRLTIPAQQRRTPSLQFER